MPCQARLVDAVRRCPHRVSCYHEEEQKKKTAKNCFSNAGMLPLWSTGRDAVAETGTVIWRQLLLLGFDAPAYMKLEGIRDVDALGPKMFMSQSPNKAGLYSALHFLFGALDPTYTQVCPGAAPYTVCQRHPDHCGSRPRPPAASEALFPNV